MAGQGLKLIVCPPGPMATWIYGLMQVAASKFGYPVQFIDRSDVIPEDTPTAIFVCQFPSLSAIELIRAGRLDAIYIAVNIPWGIAALLASGRTLPEALRLFTASMAANLAIGATSRSRAVYPALDQPAALTARSLLAHCGLPADPATVNSIVEAASGEGDTVLFDVLARKSPHTLDVTLSEEHSIVVNKVLGGLAAFAQGDLNTPIVWPTDVYFYGDQPNTPVPAIAPVSGPSRVMVYGPYLHLPPANYRVELIIAFAGRIEEIPFLLEVHAGTECIARLRLDGRKSGGYRGRFNLLVTDPVHHLEVRLRNERGAIEGEVSLVELRFYAPGAAEISAS